MSKEHIVALSGRTVRGVRIGNRVMIEYRGEVVCLAEVARRSGFHVKTVYDWHVKGRLERGYAELMEHRRELRKRAYAMGIRPGTLTMRLHRGGDPLAPVKKRARRAA
jgi:hypothetical protein